MRIVDLILAKRAGKEHSAAEIDFIVKGTTDNSSPDYQLSAWLMAAFLKGLTMDESTSFADAMSKSGDVLDLSAVGPLVGDKHSTGGVGDKTTLVFVPMMAAAGVPMAKLSGRRLGHAGGTIDKLEAIPGFRTNLSTQDFIRQVKEVGMAICAQSKDLAPADGRFYALRHRTGTVESMPLIASSIMSNKIASGANFVLVDVKCGRGAYFDSMEKAEKLAQMLVEIGRRLGKPVSSVVTDMEQPLGNAVGHSLEVIEAIDCLKGEGPADLRELCLALGAIALVSAKKCASETEARRKLEEVIDSGAALKSFRNLIIAQQGDPAVVDDYSILPKAPMQFELTAPIKRGSSKYVSMLDGKKVAEACKILGETNASVQSPIDFGVGIVLKAKVGSHVSAGDPIATVRSNSEYLYEKAKLTLEDAFVFADAPLAAQPIVRSCIN